MWDLIECNTIKTAYRLIGPDGAPVIMFGNSLMCDFGMWRSQVDALSDRFRVLLYDLRGQGRTETPPGPYAIDQFADDAYELVWGLGVDRVHFVGLSFGGLIGQRLAVKYPQVVHSLTLCDTGSRFPPKEIWDERISIASSEGMPGVAGPTLKRWFPNGPSKAATHSLDEVRRMILATPVDGFCHCCRTLRDTDLTDQLGRIEAPSLVVFGSGDPLAALSRELHRDLPRSRCVEIEGAGHLANVDRPEAFNAAIAESVRVSVECNALASRVSGLTVF